MNIQKILKNTLKAGALTLALTTSSQVFGQHVASTQRAYHISADTDGSGNEGIVFKIRNGEVGWFHSNGLFSAQKGLQVIGNTLVTGNTQSKTINATQHINTPALRTYNDLYVDGRIHFKDNKLNVPTIDVGNLNASNNITTTKDIIASGSLRSKNVNAQAGVFQGLTVNFQNVNNNLVVKGSVSAKRVSLEVGTFPDYVFEPSYKLKPLEEVEAFIKKHHHLPNVPAAQKVIKEGMNVGQMNVLLMEKVEELTLHAIAQNKQIKQLLKEVKTLKATVKSKK